jgi:hypothetical protein
MPANALSSADSPLAVRSAVLMSSHACFCAASSAKRVAEYMRMTTAHFAADRVSDIGKIEQPSFLCHLRMENDLQQQITQFVAQIIPVTAIDRIGNLVGFFDACTVRWRQNPASHPTGNRVRDRAGAP